MPLPGCSLDTHSDSSRWVTSEHCSVFLSQYSPPFYLSTHQLHFRLFPSCCPTMPLPLSPQLLSTFQLFPLSLSCLPHCLSPDYIHPYFPFFSPWFLFFLSALLLLFSFVIPLQKKLQIQHELLANRLKVLIFHTHFSQCYSAANEKPLWVYDGIDGKKQKPHSSAVSIIRSSCLTTVLSFLANHNVFHVNYSSRYTFEIMSVKMGPTLT